MSDYPKKKIHKKIMGAMGAGLFLFSVILCVCLFLYHKTSSQNYQAFLTLACFVDDYYEDAASGYATIKVNTLNGEKEKTFRVEDAELKNMLSSVMLDSREVIGISLSCSIPYRELEKNHFDTTNIDGFELFFQTDIYDSYYMITNVFMEEQSSGKY